MAMGKLNIGASTHPEAKGLGGRCPKRGTCHRRAGEAHTDAMQSNAMQGKARESKAKKGDKPKKA